MILHSAQVGEWCDVRFCIGVQGRAVGKVNGWRQEEGLRWVPAEMGDGVGRALGAAGAEQPPTAKRSQQPQQPQKTNRELQLHDGVLGLLEEVLLLAGALEFGPLVAGDGVAGLVDDGDVRGAPGDRHRGDHLPHLLVLGGALRADGGDGDLGAHLVGSVRDRVVDAGGDAPARWQGGLDVEVHQGGQGDGGADAFGDDGWGQRVGVVKFLRLAHAAGDEQTHDEHHQAEEGEAERA